MIFAEKGLTNNIYISKLIYICKLCGGRSRNLIISKKTVMKDENSAILLVDDSSTNNLLLQTVLGKNGFTTEVAFSGKDALKILKKKKISIILLDLMMPGMSGQEVLEAVKSNPETAQIPVLVVSAYNDNAEKERVMGMGADFFFEKPLRLNEVVDKVKEILG